uniref:MSP domain-containing protein n=1 Tax=Aegilops tauschii subsp. strangulata TaxID=200361 RepID=A0A453TEB3_AEGTS
RGYLAPECYCGEKIAITHKFDLYSLGVIIIEILTGKKGYQIAIENVLEIWSNMMLDALQWEQLRVCARIGIECTDLDPGKRPASMKHIVDALAQTECSTHLSPAGGESELLLLQQFTLCFPFEPNKVITCPLQLTNNTDKHVAFRLTDKSMESSFIRLPLYGIVPPNTPFTLIITTQEKEELPQKYIIDVILHNATLILEDDEYINTFQSQPDNFFREMGNAVQEVKLKALYTLPRHITPSLSKLISPTIKDNNRR